MKIASQPKIASAILLALTIILCAAVSQSQDKDSDSKDKSDSKGIRLTIVVTSAETKQPVDSASVYLRYVTERKLAKDKKIEMNLKTNQSGICHAPEIPRGKFLIQVIAPGWKTYGEYYELDQPEQTISIALARPPKWY